MELPDEILSEEIFKYLRLNDIKNFLLTNKEFLNNSYLIKEYQIRKDYEYFLKTKYNNSLYYVIIDNDIKAAKYITEIFNNGIVDIKFLEYLLKIIIYDSIDVRSVGKYLLSKNKYSNLFNHFEIKHKMFSYNDQYYELYLYSQNLGLVPKFNLEIFNDIIKENLPEYYCIFITQLNQQLFNGLFDLDPIVIKILIKKLKNVLKTNNKSNLIYKHFQELYIYLSNLI
jgi:hypothetical protein